MINKILRSTLAVSVGITLATPATVMATNGMMLIGVGNKSRAMGGVAIATPLDSLSGATNPAVISGMGNRFDIGIDIFIPEAESCLGSVCAESEANINGVGLDKTFFMPAMAVTYQYSDDITLGFSMAPAGGGGTKFETNFFEAASAGSINTSTINDKLGVDLMVMEMNPTIAYAIDDKNNVGLSLVIGVARFNAFGLSLFDTFTQTQGTTDDFTNQGKDWTGGAGIRLGWYGDYGNFTLGAAYSSKVYMQEFNRYEELFAEHGSMDFPANVGIGASYKFNDDLLVAMDVTYTMYEDVAAIGNIGPNLAGDPDGPLGSDDRKLGLDDGMGFGWSNQTVIKLGAQYRYSEKIILRGGWNYGESPINEDREIIFNLLAPASTQHHLTLGATYDYSPDIELNVSYVHAFEYEQSGPTYISDDGSNYGSLKMSQNSLGFSLSYKF